MLPPQPCGSGVCSLRGRLNVALASRARPMTERQSGRFGVISNSTMESSKPRMCAMLRPGSASSSCKTKIPSAMQWGNSFCSACRSSSVQIVSLFVLYATRSPSC